MVNHQKGSHIVSDDRRHPSSCACQTRTPRHVRRHFLGSPSVAVICFDICGGDSEMAYQHVIAISAGLRGDVWADEQGGLSPRDCYALGHGGYLRLRFCPCHKRCSPCCRVRRTALEQPIQESSHALARLMLRDPNPWSSRLHSETTLSSETHLATSSSA